MKRKVELIDCIHEAPEGSRELDAEISVFMNFEHSALSMPTKNAHCKPGTYWQGLNPSALQTSPRYTTSIDAAITLVSEKGNKYMALYYASKDYIDYHKNADYADLWPFIKAICIRGLRERDCP